MKIAAMTMIRHDADVLEEFVRHTLEIVDELFVYNNVSLDASVSILQALQQEGLPIVVSPCDVLAGGGEAADYTDLVLDVWSNTDASFLALLDADEFIVTTRAALEAELAALPIGHHATLAWKNYVPTTADPIDEVRTLARIQFRHEREARPEVKVIVSRAFLDSPQSRVMLGSHGVIGAPMTALVSAHIAHFPIRSIAQAQAKSLLGWSTFMALGWVRRGTLGFQWERLYRLLKQSSDWTAGDFVNYGQSYFERGENDAHGPRRLVRDPLQPVSRRYLYPDMSLMEVAIALTQQLAETLSRVSDDHLTRAAGNAASRIAQLAGAVDRLTQAIERVANERDGLRRDVQHVSAERDMLLAYVHQLRSSERGSSDGAARHGTPQREPDAS